MRDGWIIRRRRAEEFMACFVTLPVWNNQRGRKDKKITLRDIFGKNYHKRFPSDKPTAREIAKEFWDDG
ncbi:MAG: hypothetical protein LBP78_06685 [Acidaminococcales bacterium]|jgi:hypothetical protein|nr:hypothetical protein [Acidaminococcales bacterium]